MELAQTKIPYLPPEWTVERGVKYLAKLAAFILVPGLHQMACKRWVLGGLLMVIYFAGELTLAYKPLNYAHLGFPDYALANNLSDVSQYVSWLMLLIGVRKLEAVKPRRNLFFYLSCAAGIYFVPHHNPGILNLHVENLQLACPDFCKNDIVEFEHYWQQIPSYRQNISVGDYVIVTRRSGELFTTRILAGPPEEACNGDGRTPFRLSIDNDFCRKMYGENYLFKYLILDDRKSIFTSQGDRNISMITDYDILGLYPNKLGNTRKYFILTDNISDFVGNALLNIYGWTGLNLLGLSELHSPISHKHH